MKQAQVSIFILIGLLVLLFVGFFVFYGRIYNNQKTIQQQTNDAVVQQLILSCFEPIAEEGLFVSAFQGGYIEITDKKEDFQRKQQYYYYYDNISPNLTHIYSLLEWYIINNTITCIEENANQQKYDFSIDAAHSKVTFISDQETEVHLYLPLTLTTETAQSTLSDFSTTISVPFEKMYGIAREIVDNLATTDPLVCMTCLHYLAESHDLLLSINDYQEIADYYVLYDPSHDLYGMPFTFSFAVQMQKDLDPSVYIGKHPELKLELPSYTAYINEEFILNINTEEFLQQVIPQFIQDPTYSLSFSDFTPLFAIDPVLGIIRFTPTEMQKGEYTILLKIEDSRGIVEYASMKLVIV